MEKSRNLKIIFLNPGLNDRFRPFSPNIVNELRRYFRISLTWSSNAIEGNTLTESETKAVLEDGLTIGGKQMREHLEVLGHGDA